MFQGWDEILQIELADAVESGASAPGYQNMGCREGIVHLGKKTTPTLNRILERKREGEKNKREIYEREREIDIYGEMKQTGREERTEKERKKKEKEKE